MYRVDVLGDMVFFGGRFSMVDGSTRNNAAAVKGAPGAMDDGSLLEWNPDLAGEITLDWGTPSLGARPTSDVIEAGTAPGLSNLASLPVSATSFAVAGVPSGVYYLRVRAVGPGGVGPVGNELTLVVP